VYVPPEDNTHANKILRTLKWILTRIKYVDKDSRVIVGGDLNRVGMRKVDFIEHKFGLTKLLSEEMATHNRGGHLDNVWTNLKVT
jgi:hypothetical protein